MPSHQVQVAVFHFMASGKYLPENSPAKNWGQFVMYVEVGEDRRATRQVSVFKNGNMLRYDRSHCRDSFGYLTGPLFSQKQKWRKFFPGAEIICPSDFEQIWNRSLASPLWAAQMESSSPP